MYLFLEIGERKEKDREGNINVREKHLSVASHTLPNGVLAHNPGMCPDQESNEPPFLRRLALNLLSHTSQVGNIFLNTLRKFIVISLSSLNLNLE